jgi:hypothetical protein
MQSTQVTDEIFAGQFDLIVQDPKFLAGFDTDAEVMITISPMADQPADKTAPPLR